MAVKMLNEDWQSETSLKDALWKLQQNQVNCDVFFEVGPDLERIGAHSAVLMATSVAFFRQFSGGLPEEDIYLADYLPEEVNCLLRYLYRRETDIGTLDGEKMIRLAERFGAIDFVRILIAGILRDMDTSTFCTFVRHNENHMTELIRFKCLEYVFTKPFQVFQSAAFTELPKTFLQEILGHEMLVIDEEVLCTAMLVWASKECEKAKLAVNGRNQRRVLDNLLYLIRFPLLSQDYFTENISEKGLLKESEELQVLKLFLHSKNKPKNVAFETKKRVAPATPFTFVPHIRAEALACGGCSNLHSIGSRPILATDETMKSGYVCRYTEKGRGWAYKFDRRDAIAFTVDKNIILNYIDIYGNCSTNGTMEVSIVIRDDQKEISETDVTVDCTLNNVRGLYEVGIENSTGSYGILIRAGVKHHVILGITGGNTWYGKAGRAKCFSEGVQFEFFNSEYDSNKTSIGIGQMAGFKYSIV